MNIFPNLKKGKWTLVNLNEESQKTKTDLSDPVVCGNFIDNLHKQRGADYSFGGFQEDRTYLWRNNLNERADSLIHLGIDYSVPAGTEICLPTHAQVYHIMKDPENNLGWGGRIIFKLENRNYLLYGHLKQDIRLKVMDKINKNQIVCILADKHENGNWWPHLHAQLMTQEFIDNYKDNLNKIDGYLPEGNKNIKNCINPNSFIF